MLYYKILEFKFPQIQILINKNPYGIHRKLFLFFIPPYHHHNRVALKTTKSTKSKKVLNYDLVCLRDFIFYLLLFIIYQIVPNPVRGNEYKILTFNKLL